MPTDCKDTLPEFTSYLANLSAIVENSDLKSVYVLGDFNAHPPSALFYNEMV